MSINDNGILPIVLINSNQEDIERFQKILISDNFESLWLYNNVKASMSLVDTEKKIGVIIIDFDFPEKVAGEDLFVKLIVQYPTVPIIVVTADNDIETAVRCVKRGAFDYLIKPVSEDRFLRTVRAAVETLSVEKKQTMFHTHDNSAELQNPENFKSIVTQNKSMQTMFYYIEAIADSSKHILITGETGTGKTLVAKAIHDASGRAGEFVHVNVAGIDDALFADTLFGHRKGSFTSAVGARSGMIQRAENGTLFLDEIGDLSSKSQVRLLQLLEQREYYPIGEDAPVKTNARIVAATNADLKACVNEGAFRKDLFYRLHTHHIDIPPLRERLDDLSLLLSEFIIEAANDFGKSKLVYPSELITLLNTYQFPGNVRELQSMVQNAVALATGNTLSMDTFKQAVMSEAPYESENTGDAAISVKRAIRQTEKLPSVKEMEIFLIKEAVKRSDGNQSIAAEILGISRQSVGKKIKKYNVDCD